MPKNLPDHCSCFSKIGPQGRFWFLEPRLRPLFVWVRFSSRKSTLRFATMIGENRQLVTDEPVEFEKEPVEVQDCRRITDHFRGIYRIYPNLIKENWRMSTYNRLDLQTIGSQPIMPKNLPDHWFAMCLLEGDKYLDLFSKSSPQPSLNLPFHFLRVSKVKPSGEFVGLRSRFKFPEFKKIWSTTTKAIFSEVDGLDFLVSWAFCLGECMLSLGKEAPWCVFWGVECQSLASRRV